MCDVYNLTPDYIDKNMSISEVYAYAISARKYLREKNNEQAIIHANCIAKSLFGAPANDVVSRNAETFEEFKIAMGVGI